MSPCLHLQLSGSCNQIQKLLLTTNGWHILFQVNSQMMVENNLIFHLISSECMYGLIIQNDTCICDDVKWIWRSVTVMYPWLIVDWLNPEWHHNQADLWHVIKSYDKTEISIWLLTHTTQIESNRKLCSCDIIITCDFIAGLPFQYRKWKLKLKKKVCVYLLCTVCNTMAW